MVADCERQTDRGISLVAVAVLVMIVVNKHVDATSVLKRKWKKLCRRLRTAHWQWSVGIRRLRSITGRLAVVDRAKIVFVLVRAKSVAVLQFHYLRHLAHGLGPWWELFRIIITIIVFCRGPHQPALQGLNVER